MINLFQLNFIQVELYNRKINIGDRDLFERGIRYENDDDNEMAFVSYRRAGVFLCVYISIFL